MKPRLQPERIKQTKWYEYLIRFAFGGIITAIAGYMGRKYGPGVGGLFLAFPAILPASVTLIEKHHGRMAAGVDTYGACFGSIGLIAFGAVVWARGGQMPAWAVLLLATIAWFLLSAALWLTRQGIQMARHAAEKHRGRPDRPETQPRGGRSPAR